MKIFIRLSGILILALMAHSVDAAGRYQVEVIVFAQYMHNTELLDQTQSQIQWPNRVVDLSAFAEVGPQNRLLNGAYGALARTAGYKLLLHVSWIQNIGANRTGDAVRIQGANGSVNGFVRVQRGQHLKLVVDLEYQPNASRFYRLHEKRRIKFNETHYLDHPKFGVIAKVRPL
ncbi:MAG: CsiV family protein [Gammaproteobacteria bacterium]